MITRVYDHGSGWITHNSWDHYGDCCLRATPIWVRVTATAGPYCITGYEVVTKPMWQQAWRMARRGSEDAPLLAVRLLEVRQEVEAATLAQQRKHFYPTRTLRRLLTTIRSDERGFINWQMLDSGTREYGHFGSRSQAWDLVACPVCGAMAGRAWGYHGTCSVACSQQV
jgi:hypothetical protein